MACATRRGGTGGGRARGRSSARRARGGAARSSAAGPGGVATPAVVVLPGLGNAAGDYDELVVELEGRGAVVVTADVKRYDWLRNAAGVVRPEYWAGELEPLPTVQWYVDYIAAAVAEARRRSGAERVALLAHSAGGWMARVYLEQLGAEASVERLVTIGSPLVAPPTDVPGIVDQTRGILTYVTANCPGPGDNGVPFVCVAGKYLEGVDLDGVAPNAERLSQLAVGLGYKQVCGYADVWGDGITPVAAAQLPGAENVTLEGVYHSPLGAAEGRPWYGTPGVLEQWVDYLLGPSPNPVRQRRGAVAASAAAA